jgi:chorismate mutase
LVRGIRGATTVANNARVAILEAVQELLTAMIQENNVLADDMATIIFSSTPDLNSTFPAAGARAMGLTDVPLFGTQEIDNPLGVPSCIRILILWNTDLPLRAIHHIYLHEAIKLRPDIAAQK